MSYAPIALTMPNYSEYGGYWLKAYEQGTTTPLSMATDTTGTTLLVKCEIDAQGFPITTGIARFIPFIEGSYDLWMFPEPEEADSNITINAIQLADNLNADPNSEGMDKYYDTLALAVADVANISEGDIIILKERVSGNGGGATWDVVDATTVTENEFNIVTGNETVSFVLRYSNTLCSKQWGAPGDGTTQTLAVQNMFDTAAAYDKIVLEPGNYSIGTITSSQNQQIIADGALFTLVGDNAGFQVNGTIDYYRVQGGIITGDGAVRDADPTKAQIGWLFSNGVGDDVEDVTLQDVQVKSANIGIKIAYGTSPNEVTLKTYILNCEIEGSIGKAGGVGYGVQFTQAPRGQIIGGSIRDCDRHGLYFSEGEQYQAMGVDVSGCGYNDGTIRGAVNIARSAVVSMTTMNIHDNNDVGLLIDTDSQGISPNDLKTIVVSANTFKNNKYGEIIIGSVTPATDGVPVGVKVIGNSIHPLPAGTANIINIRSGKRISFSDNLIDGTDRTTSCRAFVIESYDGGGYTDKIYIKNNEVELPSASSSYLCQIGSELCTSSDSLVIEGNKATVVTEEFNFMVAGGEKNITNDNLLYKRSNGKCHRVYDGISSTISVGGVDSLNIQPSAATDITALTGMTEGQELTFYFTNANATLKASYFYNDAGGDFIGSNHDTTKYIYSAGGWRMISKSVNF